MKRLFLLALMAALSFHVFAHWHTQDHHKRGEEAHHASSFCFQPIIGITGFLLACGGLLLFSRHRSTLAEEIDHDGRALSEGLRVQFYWCLCGLRRSVPANYMQRQRSEMDWIRNAIAALAAPYERWQKDFLHLGAKSQLALFRATRDAWISEQASYHEGATSTRSRKLHHWHSLGKILATTGLCLALFLIGASLGDHFPPLGGDLAWSGWLLAAGGCLLLGSVVHTGRLQGWNSEHSEEKSLLERVVHRLLPSRHGRNYAYLTYSHENRENLDFMAFARLLPVALGLTCVLLSLCFLVPIPSSSLPSTMDFAIVAMGFCLVSGALSIAWSEKNLYSEHARQFESMTSLFSASLNRMDGYLETFEAAIKKKNKAAQHEARENIHKLLFALGKEALDENAEWLLLHRARPMEPVMAG